ncbi:MAG TPA: cellulase family glycosylhydrolase [Patescibacteria group bacterium]|nr:cellulase family glycosylhydrolase [Patescibacteria group bacterium]
MRKHININIILIIMILFIVVFIYLIKVAKYYPQNPNLKASENFFGVTYSDKFAKELKLDPVKAHQDIINDLQVKYIRLPIYWDQVEKKEGNFDFSQYEKMLQDGKKNNVKYIVSIGYRLPRWPECHFPKWMDEEDIRNKDDKVLSYLKKTVNHFKNYDNILYWQVENEPFLNSFGICPKYDENLLMQEIDLVKKLDDRKIIISASGELGAWNKENKIADIFATTLYRVVYNPVLGYFRYPLPPWVYKLKAKATGVDINESLLIELQAEPWIKNGTLADAKADEYNKSFSVDQFKANTDYAIRTDFKQVYFWGVEWWYLQNLKGNNEYYNLAKEIFKN